MTTPTPVKGEVQTPQRWNGWELARDPSGPFVTIEDYRQLERANAQLQAKIDALMLEYCPDEMTPEQVENWKRHQKSRP